MDDELNVEELKKRGWKGEADMGEEEKEKNEA